MELSMSGIDINFVGFFTYNPILVFELEVKSVIRSVH
jgi:hypothetical protein